MALNQGLFTSNTDEWATPQDFFDALDKEFHFSLDVAATKENAKCAKFYTAEDDGLQKSWGGVYGAILRMAGKSAFGSKKPMRAPTTITAPSLCFFRQEPTQNGSTNLSCTGRKSDLSQAG